jgi:hypothetical protein
MTLAEILIDSYYKLTQFNFVEINNFEKRIIKRGVVLAIEMDEESATNYINSQTKQ